MDVKINNSLRDLCAGIAMDVENQQLFMRPICEYCNEYNKINEYYGIYMKVLF